MDEQTTCGRCGQPLMWLRILSDTTDARQPEGIPFMVQGWFSGDLTLDGATLSRSCPARGTKQLHKAPYPEIKSSAAGAAKRSGR